MAGFYTSWSPHLFAFSLAHSVPTDRPSRDQTLSVGTHTYDVVVLVAASTLGPRGVGAVGQGPKDRVQGEGVAAVVHVGEAVGAGQRQADCQR